jgi:hypothetical protein
VSKHVFTLYTAALGSRITITAHLAHYFRRILNSMDDFAYDGGSRWYPAGPSHLERRSTTEIGDSWHSSDRLFHSLSHLSEDPLEALLDLKAQCRPINMLAHHLVHIVQN